jgi:hypothetical protein
MRGYCWRVGITVELGGKCPECGNMHDPIPDQTKCAAYVAVGPKEWGPGVGLQRGEPCDLPYGHEGECRLLPDSPGLDGQASKVPQAGHGGGEK